MKFCIWNSVRASRMYFQIFLLVPFASIFLSRSERWQTLEANVFFCGVMWGLASLAAWTYPLYSGVFWGWPEAIYTVFAGHTCFVALVLQKELESDRRFAALTKRKGRRAA